MCRVRAFLRSLSLIRRKGHPFEQMSSFSGVTHYEPSSLPTDRESPR